ncbi:DUF4339 domain-containing protein [Flavobacterium sp. RSP15]|uniref:DUF4339 domain-containing protein n=1 Tax=Flavobacterium sp. RSP15 TaxID=2497485 RepID=UPI000F82114E|nr:DUF4339 domain-containing protein [Flavobacterium sp. RSP15]RTY86176.1 DUF4339 domain-containing protein [Flavobacterium sp. RSP15]
MIKFYVLDNNQQKGPFSENELKSMLLTNDTLVWREEMENWDYAKNIEELKIFINSTPPPIPNFENLNSSININVKTHKSELDEKENHLKKERIKSKFAYELVYFIKCIIFSILFIVILPWKEMYEDLFGIHRDYYALSPFSSSENFDVYFFLCYFYLIIMFLILFHRPIFQSFKWLKKYSNKGN